MVETVLSRLPDGLSGIRGAVDVEVDATALSNAELKEDCPAG